MRHNQGFLQAKITKKIHIFLEGLLCSLQHLLHSGNLSCISISITHPIIIALLYLSTASFNIVFHVYFIATDYQHLTDGKSAPHQNAPQSPFPIAWIVIYIIQHKQICVKRKYTGFYVIACSPWWWRIETLCHLLNAPGCNLQERVRERTCELACFHALWLQLD